MIPFIESSKTGKQFCGVRIVITYGGGGGVCGEARVGID